MMTEDSADIEGRLDVGTPSTAPDEQGPVEEYNSQSDGSEETTDGDEYDTDGGESSDFCDEDSEEVGEDTEDSDGTTSSDREYEDDDMMFNNDYSYYDNKEKRWVEKGDLEAAELYMRCTANAHRFVTMDLQEKLEEAGRFIDELLEHEKALKERCVSLQEKNKMLEAGHKSAERVPGLIEENEDLKRRLKATTQLYMDLQTEVRDLVQTQKELEEVERIELLGFKVTLRGNRVVRQDTFDIEPLLNEARNKERTANELMERMEQSRMEIIRLSKNEESLQHANNTLESAKRSLEETVAQFRPCISAAESELATQRQMNSRLEQRNRQLEEQLRHANACAGPAFGTGEQSLMERVRGMPGVFERIPLTVTHQ